MDQAAAGTPTDGGGASAPADAGGDAGGDAGAIDGEGGGGELPVGDVGGAPAEPGAAEPEGGEPAPEPAAAKPGPNLTARLAKLSREKREQSIELRAAKAAAEEASARATKLETAITAAKRGDETALVDLLEGTLGVSFEKIVDVYAKRGDQQQLTPEQQTSKAIEELRAQLAEEKKAREDYLKETAQRSEQARTAEMVGGIAQVVKTNAEKFKICARVGNDAANEIFAEVSKAWERAGRPQLMPGEYDEAVLAAADLVEVRYEERRRLLNGEAANGNSKSAPANGNGKASGAAAPAPAPKRGTATKITTRVPSDFFDATELSDTDKAILDGLGDKKAPMVTVGKPKPRTINSGLGGSAPTGRSPRGSQDPREALRDVLAANGLDRH